MVIGILFVVMIFVIFLFKDFKQSKTNEVINKQNPEDAETLEKLCEKYADKKRFADAGKVCSLYLKNNPDNYEWVLQGVLYYSMHSAYNSDKASFENYVLPHIKRIDEIVADPILYEKTKSENKHFNTSLIGSIYRIYSKHLESRNMKSEASIYLTKAENLS